MSNDDTTLPGEEEGGVPRITGGDPAFGEEINELYSDRWAGDLDDIGTVTLQEEVPGSDIDEELLREDVNRPDSWLHTNKGYQQTGFAPSDALTPDDVDTLELEWQLTDIAGGNRSAPIVVPGDPPVMYFTDNSHKIWALDARTGDTFWTATPEFDPDHKNWSNRGVAVAGDSVYITTPGPAIAALDRYTGEQRWSTIMLTEHQAEEMTSPHQRIGVTQAPFVYNGTVYSGQTGDSNGWCAVSALDAESGEIVWQHETIPQDAWVGETWRHGSGGAWMTGSADPETNQIFYSIGQPCPMFNPNVRPGPNQLTCAMIAYDADSGEVNWSTQLYAHELWDYDLDTVPVVMDMEVDGETRRVVETAPKGGWDWFLDAETGQILERSRPYVRQNHEWADHFLALPPRGEENKANFYPSDSTEWPNDAYSPKAGLRYIGANDSPNSLYYDPDWEYGPDNFDAVGGGKDDPVPPYTSYGYVVAIEPDTGEIAWRYQLPDVQEDWSEWRAWTGGTTATAGDLVFHGSSGGNLIGLHAETGEELWRDDIGKRITASPTIWDDTADGRQFVAIGANDQLNVYAGGGQ